MELKCDNCNKKVLTTITNDSRIKPFCNLKKNSDINLLLQYFLYYAPTIDSRLSVVEIEKNLMGSCLELMLRDRHFTGRFINSNSKFTKEDDFTIGNEICLKCKRYICRRKDLKANESDFECFLRHIRNSIAHGNVFSLNQNKNKVYVFDDYNKNGNLSSRIICLQADLESWKKTIIRFSKS